MKRRIVSTFLSLAVAVTACAGLCSPAQAAGERVTLRAASENGKIAVTVAVEGASFNVLQFAVRYDTARLTPVSPEGGTATEAAEMESVLAPVYERGSGWLAGTESGTLDKTAGVLEQMLYVHENSKGAANGSDADGYVTAAEPLPVLKLYFEKKAGATLYSDSIALTKTANNDTGIILATKNTADLSAPAILTDAGLVQVDLSAVAEAGKTPGGGSSTGGGAGGSAGSGNSSTGGGSSAGGGSTGGTSTGSGGSTTGGGTTAGTPTTGLTDISGTWAKDSIGRLVTKGVLSGYPDGTYRPENRVTRAEFTKVLAGVMNLAPAQDAGGFADANASWAAGYIGAAHRAGYVSGVSASAFEPEAPVTREQMAVMIARAKSYPAAQKRFADGEQISEWAREAVSAAAGAGVIQGDADGRFRPQDPVTRAEMAAMVDRMTAA